MPARRELVHVRPDLGHQHLGGPPAHPRDRRQPPGRVRERGQGSLDPPPHAGDQGLQVLEVVQVQPGQTLLTVFDGEVTLTNPQGSLVLTNGEQGSVLPGQAPVKTAVIQATNIVQWWLYYPAVLDLRELPFSAAEAAVLGPSTNAYLSGDLRGALEAYPAGRTPQSDAERIYYAGLLLSVGQVDKAEALLGAVTNRVRHTWQIRRGR